MPTKLQLLADPDCTACPLHEWTDRVCIPVNPATKKLPTGRMIVVGEAPGYSEEETGLLFSGSAGQLLWSELDKLGLPRSVFYVTNAVKCRPRDNATPTPGQISTCVGRYLTKELELIKPKFGLALGNSGLKATLGRQGITKMNGQTFESMGTTWVAAFHPAAVLRNPRYASQFRQALLVFKRLVFDEDGLPETKTVMVNDTGSLKLLLAELRAADEGALDIETFGTLEPHGNFPGGGLAWWDPEFRIVSINFSFKSGKAFVLILWHERSRWKDPQKIVELIKPEVERHGWFMQNGKFDEHGLASVGIITHQSIDTMGVQYALDENVAKDLGTLSSVYLGAPPYKDTLDKGDLYHAPLPGLVEYGGKDADYTYRLGKVLPKRLRAEPLADRLFRKLLMPATNTLTRVEAVGIPIHRGKFEKRWGQTEEFIEAAVERIQEFVPDNMRPFNPNSPTQVGRLLFDNMGLPIIEQTKTGRPSTREGVLLRLQDLDDSGVLDAILEYRMWAGRESRYFKSWDYFMDGDNRIHPNFKPFHTVTGRLSCDNPNMQQVARDPFIRGMIGGRKGWMIVEADYSQVELRIAAHITQDRNLLRAFSSGMDVHLETAMAVTGLAESEVTPEIRKQAKAVNFGYLYGMGWRRFMSYAKENYGVSVNEAQAQDSRQTFFETYRKLQAWHNRQRKVALDRKWVISPIGRKRRLWDVDSSNEEIRAEAQRQAINSPVQSMASDMMLMAMYLLDQKINWNVCRIIGTVHDSILFEIQDEWVDHYVPIIRETMENLPLEEEFDCLLTVPIVADLKVGRYWSEGAVSV